VGAVGSVATGYEYGPHKCHVTHHQTGGLQECKSVVPVDNCQWNKDAALTVSVRIQSILHTSVGSVNIVLHRNSQYQGLCRRVLLCQH